MSEYCERLLVEARRRIGTETPIRWARYPVEHEPIRRWCHMVACDAPLFLDPGMRRPVLGARSSARR